jgi:predicted polyphosphate/ATP-dependent NAD kinase
MPHDQNNPRTFHIGFLVNPIAGMGGRVGLKGTDGVLTEAKARGATPIADHKATETLRALRTIIPTATIHWYTCAGAMGQDILRSLHEPHITIVYTPQKQETTTADTTRACTQFVAERLDLVLFCGGDGTARDVFSILGTKTPLLGIPSGVKMHSGVFGLSTEATAKCLAAYLQGTLTTGDVDILDVDEQAYRKGEWHVKLYGVAKGLIEPTYIQVGKATFESVSDDMVKDELADHIKDEMTRNPNTLFILGPGGTIDYIATKNGIAHTLLGIDAVYQGTLLKNDLNEHDLLTLLEEYKDVKLVLSPIGAQGFILGRGNLQLSPAVVKKIGIDNIIIVATPAKLAETPLIRVDTGDPHLDAQFSTKEYFLVVIGYRLSRVVKIQTNPTQTQEP